MYISAESNDGNAHDVRMYSDITGGEHETICCRNQRSNLLIEFLASKKPGVNVTWNGADLGEYVILSMKPAVPEPLAESSDLASDAIEYYCFKKVIEAFVTIFFLH